MASKEGTVAEVAVMPICDFCKMTDPHTHVEASFDAKTRQGPWANMCTVHYGLYGTGLGVGRGQRLVLAVKEEAPEQDSIFCEMHNERHPLKASLPCFEALVAKAAAAEDPYAGID